MCSGSVGPLSTQQQVQQLASFLSCLLVFESVTCEVVCLCHPLEQEGLMVSPQNLRPVEAFSFFLFVVHLLGIKADLRSVPVGYF